MGKITLAFLTSADNGTRLIRERQHPLSMNQKVGHHMPSQIRKLRQVPEQFRPSRRPRLVVHRPVHQLPLIVEMVRVEPEEVLIADARGSLTPTQMVERKLMALLRDVGPGVSLQRSDGPADFRRGGNPPSSSLRGLNRQRDQTRFAGH